MEIKNLGQLYGPVLVFGGVYSNLPALEALEVAAEQHAIAPGNIICTGDVVGYCAEPEAVVQRVKEWGVHTIAGNVELQLREGADNCGCDFNAGGRCDVFSRQWYPYAQSKLSNDSLRWMRALPDHLHFTYANLQVRVLHGAMDAVAGYVFASTRWEEKKYQLDAAGAQVILGGHCGLPFASTQNDEYWLNAGVIGMPANDATTSVWYMILDDSLGKFSYTFHRLVYDHQSAAARMRSQCLPEAYALTLETGLWDNCEILPTIETSLQGQRIVL